MGIKHGTQTSTVWAMGVPTHFPGGGNSGAGLDRGVYRPPPEHGCTIHCNSSYHDLMYSGKAEYVTETIKSIVGASPSGYPSYKSGTCSSGGGRGYGGGGIGGRGR